MLLLLLLLEGIKIYGDVYSYPKATNNSNNNDNNMYFENSLSGLNAD